jgi:hypothetical protein
MPRRDHKELQRQDQQINKRTLLHLEESCFLHGKEQEVEKWIYNPFFEWICKCGDIFDERAVVKKMVRANVNHIFPFVGVGEVEETVNNFIS